MGALHTRRRPCCPSDTLASCRQYLQRSRTEASLWRTGARTRFSCPSPSTKSLDEIPQDTLKGITRGYSPSMCAILADLTQVGADVGLARGVPHVVAHRGETALAPSSGSGSTPDPHPTENERTTLDNAVSV